MLTNARMRDAFGRQSLVAVLVLALAGCADSNQSGTSNSGLGPTVASSLSSLLKTQAESLGESTPHSLRAVEATRMAALKIIEPDASDSTSSSGYDPNAEVYVLTATGHFGSRGEKVPPGKSSASGSRLTLVVDAATLAISDTYVNDRNPDLATLGPVASLGR